MRANSALGFTPFTPTYRASSNLAWAADKRYSLGVTTRGNSMALVHCSECEREISDKAAACPGCGAPFSSSTSAQAHVTQPPDRVGYEPSSDSFTGTMTMVVKLAMRAIQQLGWKLDDANENLGLVTFQTGMSWGSWSGISGSLNIEEVATGHFKVSGSGKQNIRGGQLVALNIGGEAQSKARKAIELMKQFASQGGNA